MSRIRIAVVACLASTLFVVAPSAQAATKLVATVGPGFNITLTTGGKKVTKLKDGSYTITVRDKSNIHNFHLTGKGVNKDSGVAAVRTFTWKVTFKKGNYAYVCDPHDSSMKGTFRVV